MIKDSLLKIGFKPPKIIFFKNERRGEIKRNYSDISRAKRILGFESRIDLERGLKGVIEFFSEGKVERS